MKRERRQPTRTEWDRITSRRPVARKIRAPKGKPHSPGPIVLEDLGGRSDH